MFIRESAFIPCPEIHRGHFCVLLSIHIDTTGLDEQEIHVFGTIKLLESPIPAPPATATSSQKAHFDNISGTKRGSIDPLVSKRPEKNSE